jgi:hypothetical protein
MCSNSRGPQVRRILALAPGASFFAEGYLITASSGISVDSTGEATVTCTSDCSPFSGAQIYISGNSNNSLDGIWEVNCGATRFSRYPRQQKKPCFTLSAHNRTAQTDLDPVASLVKNRSGNLYGTTKLGGANNEDQRNFAERHQHSSRAAHCSERKARSTEE